MPRPLRRVAGAALAICTLTGVLAAAPSATASTHKRTYAVWASASRTSSARVTVRATMSATVTAKVTVPGYSTVSASTTAKDSATSAVTARATGKGRGGAVSTVRSRAAARARADAVAHAKQHSHTAAVALAKKRASAAAKALAHSRAVALAKKESIALAKKRAAALSPKAPAPVTSPGTPSSTPTPPPATDPSTTTTDPGSPGTGSDAACGGEDPTKADGSPWTCTFDDEFNGTTLDRSKWTVQTTAGSGFKAAQACFLDSPNNVSVADGVLSLTVREENAPFTCKSPLGSFATQYTSGTVNTFGTFAQAYGRFEVRAKLPAATVKGLQTSFWLWPQNDVKYGPTWPESGEIDIAEMYSYYPDRAIPFIHYVPAVSDLAVTNNYCMIKDLSAYHTYAVEWTPTAITIQYDGNTCLVDNWDAAGLTKPAPFDSPFMIALTQGLGIGGNAYVPGSTPLPATTQVDYVRIWK